MFDKKTYITIAIVLVVIAGLIFWGLKQPETAEAPVTLEPSDEITYFYSDTCSHCAEVADFLEENKIEEKVSFMKKEISDSSNSIEFEQRGAECGIARRDLGVPFLYARGKCFIGTPDVEGFFRKEAGL